MSLYLGTNCISAGGSSAFKNNNIGEIIQSTIPLSDAGLHLLDGSVISGSGSYSAFVTHIAGLVSSYPNLFTTEANWQSAVSTYGVCGKFVYDSVNNTVRLPKITGFTEGIIDPTVLGELTEAGLPNITGTIGNNIESSNNPTATGALYVTTTSSGGEGNGNYRYFGMGINASLSNPIYGNSSTVQPQSIKVLYYIVIATSTKTSIEVDIDEIATDLNSKADVDLTNTSPSSSFATVLNTSGIRTVVETWHSGSDWYRIWSDGWVEQGGTRVATTTWETITFLKPFANNNYTSLVSNTAGGTSGNGIRNKTATTMQIYQNLQYDWYACGY